MAIFTPRQSVSGRLFALARLLLAVAVKRTEQPLAVTLCLMVTLVAIASLSTFLLLPVLFGIEDDGLRRNLLNLIACALCAGLAWVTGHLAGSGRLVG